MANPETVIVVAYQTLLAQGDVPSLKSVAIGAISGIVGFAISRGVVDFVSYKIRRQGLTRMLIFECVAAINRLSEVADQIEKLNLDQLKVDSVSDVRSLPCGFVFANPNDEPHSLIRYVKPLQSKLISRFYDRWERLKILEHKYTKSFDNLLLAVARSSGQTREDADLQLAAEFGEQAKMELSEIWRDAIEICYFASQLIIDLFSEAGFHSFADIRETRNNRWKSLVEFNKDVDTWKSKFDKIQATGGRHC